MNNSTNSNSDGWKSSSPKIFWGELAPSDHLVHIYEHEETFLNLLEGFVIAGINNLECVIIIATESHLNALNNRLKAQGFNINSLCQDQQYIPLDANATLSKFMVNGWPDEKLFNTSIAQIVKLAHDRNRQIRAFGEMVTVLWSKGLNGATVHLETLWNRFCASQPFSLFCAYPKAGFTQSPADSLHKICCAHTKIISSASHSEIFYIHPQSDLTPDRLRKKFEP
jgi:hypothetical protein